MASSPFEYALLYFQMAVEALATEKGSPKERVASAMWHLTTIEDGNFPKDYVECWQSLRTETERFSDPAKRRSCYEMWLHSVSNSVGLRTAAIIWELYYCSE